MSTLRILAVDPGAETTAYVVRAGDRLEDHGTLTRDGADLRTWIAGNTLAVSAVADSHHLAAIAVEAATAPRGHAAGRPGHIIDPGPIIDTAAVVGGIVAVHGAIIVPPSGFGAPLPPGTTPRTARRILEAAYPAELIGPRETTGGGKGPHQHLRAAWDLAHAAELTLRTRRAAWTS